MQVKIKTEELRLYCKTTNFLNPRALKLIISAWQVAKTIPKERYKIKPLPIDWDVIKSSAKIPIESAVVVNKVSFRNEPMVFAGVFEIGRYFCRASGTPMSEIMDKIVIIEIK